MKFFCAFASTTVMLFLASPIYAQLTPRHHLPDNVQAKLSGLPVIKHLAETNRLDLVIGLPWRNPETLTNLLKGLYDPASTNFHQWLTADQFAGRFAPTKEDYQKIIDFARAHNLSVTHTHSNRMILNVDGAVTDIQSAFQVKLNVYQHPAENRTFYAPDTAPSVETNLPVLCVSGLDNFTLPHRVGGAPKLTALDTNRPIVPYATGSSPGGYFMGNDFRNAYAPGVTNTGVGQSIAIVDVGGPYYALDVYMYQTNAGLSTNIVVTNIITTFTSAWTNALTAGTVNEGEEVLDIDMAMSMAPGATIMNYEGEAHNVFNQIAIDNKAKQMTLSYGFGIDASIIQMFQQFAVQGQSFSQASGDGGADLDGGTGLTGNPYATIVGGSSLTTSSASGPWQSDVVWSGSGGGISGYGIPDWQQGVATAANQGSTSYRNYPDVSMPAVNIFTVYENGTQVVATGGTSAASPLWAGFMALVNQQAASNGKPAAGFVNPAIYALGRGSYSAYSSCFHDITSGNTFNNHNPLRYVAGTGYDLCSGWGTPTGSNTINFLSGVGTNDFIFYPSQGTFSLVAGGSANSVIAMSWLNGLVGAASFSISNLPAGITANISPNVTTNTATLYISTQTNTLPGSYTAMLTAVIGGISHSMPINLIIAAPIPGATSVNLSSYYNRVGFYSDGRLFGSSAGVDGSYSAYSANALGSSFSWNGLVFNLGQSNVNNVVYCAGQTISLPAGNFNTLQLLATGVQGNQTAQTFTITYTDNTTSTFTQSFSDWASPQSFSGEFVVSTMPYRNLDAGTSQNLNVTVDGYVFVLNQSKTVKSITLPVDSNLVLLSAVLANNQAIVPLAGYYNRAGIYTDGTTFTNPATGGLDGGGSAYSGTLLGGSQVWTNTLFAFGPVNATNVISATGQTIPLPTGNYTLLRMLATGIQGDQANQQFIVTYSDNTTATFTQSMSDWYTPVPYAGEAEAVVMGHRDSSDGSLDNRVFYLYGYSFNLNSAKTISSVRLPSNPNVIVTAISLVPNWQPTFILNPFTLTNANAGQTYLQTIATNANDLNGGVLTYAKVSGPAWLAVSSGGLVSGTPLSANVGTNSFVVSVADSGNLTNSATLNITVLPAPPVVSSISDQAGNVTLSWSGGISPYQIQSTTNLINPDWQNIGTVSGNSLSVIPTNNAMFYRIIGQ